MPPLGNESFVPARDGAKPLASAMSCNRLLMVSRSDTEICCVFPLMVKEMTAPGTGVPESVRSSPDADTVSGVGCSEVCKMSRLPPRPGTNSVA